MDPRTPSATLDQAPTCGYGHARAFIFCADDDQVRENVRYRIYDSCFCIRYDDDPSPLVTQYIRNWDPPPHPLFNKDSWRDTMVFRPWKHEPQGLALFRVSRTIGWESFYRFYWFHFSNFVIEASTFCELSRRLHMVPVPHRFHVNGVLKISRSVNGKATEAAQDSGDKKYQRALLYTGLDSQQVPWLEHTNLLGNRQRILLGKSYQIVEEINSERQSTFFCMAGKLGTMPFHYTKAQNARLEFNDDYFRTVRKWYESFQERIPWHIGHVPKPLSEHASRLPVRASEPLQPRYSPGLSIDNARAPTSKSDGKDSKSFRLEQSEDDDANRDRYESRLSDVVICTKIHTGQDTASTKFLRNKQPGGSCFEEETDLLRVVEVRRLTSNPDPVGRKGFLQTSDTDSKHCRESSKPLISEIPQEEEHQKTDAGDLSNLKPTSPASSTSNQPRKSSLESRISQWMKRENDKEITRRCSGSSWMDSEEVRELFSRKRVSSSNYHAYLSSSSSHREPSSGTNCSATLSRSSAERIEENVTPQKVIARKPAGNAARERPASGVQALPENTSSVTSNRAPSSITAPPTKSVPLAEKTNAMYTKHEPHTSSPPSSRQVSCMSSNVASMCVGGKRDDASEAGIDAATGVEVPNFPGAKQFLTPKKGVKPWWESDDGEVMSKSTGARRKNGRKERERGMRGSTSSWISLD